MYAGGSRFTARPACIDLNLELIACGSSGTFMPTYLVWDRQHGRDPITDPTSTNFGRVTTVSPNFMRFVTFGVKRTF